MLTLGLGLAYVIMAQQRGEKASEFVPVTMWITAVVYGVAALATFVLLKERAQPQPRRASAKASPRSMARLRQTWQSGPALRRLHVADGVRLLLPGRHRGGHRAGRGRTPSRCWASSRPTRCCWCSWSTSRPRWARFAFGYFQDRIGHKQALGATLIGWVVMTVLAYAATTARRLFWLAAVIAGLCMGSSQSAGRAMVGVFAPRERLAEYYGLWTFATSLASIVGPLTYGAVTWLTAGNHRLAIVSTGLFFVIGWLRDPADRRAARRRRGGGRQCLRARSCFRQRAHNRLGAQGPTGKRLAPPPAADVARGHPTRACRTTFRRSHVIAHQRSGARLHGANHPGHDPLPRVDRRQLGDPVLAPEGLHPGVHHRAGLHGAHRARVQEAQHQADRPERRPGGEPPQMGRRTSRRRRATCRSTR